MGLKSKASVIFFVVILGLISFTEFAYAVTNTISDDPTGGDCINIGIWTAASKTCELTNDLPIGDNIIINSDGITLEGNGHKITGDGTGIGVDVISATGVTLQNLKISNFLDGIYFDSSSVNTVTDNTISNTLYGVNFVASSSNNLVSSNFFYNNLNGAHAWPSTSNGNTVTLNTFYQSGDEQVQWHDTNDNNLVYHNNFLNPQLNQIIDECVGCTNQYSIASGGNYYDTYDEPSEGCNDVNLDGFCDDPYIITDDIGVPNGQDDLPFTVPHGWDPSLSSDTAPILVVPDDMMIGTVVTSGAVVTFSTIAIDVEDGIIPATCTPPSGSTFPLGPTVVICSVTDSDSNTVSGSFSITVEISSTLMLTIQAIDNNGLTRTMWHEIILDGTTVSTGFTPASHQITSGAEHTVAMGEFGPYVFDHWEDDSTDPFRIITPTQDTTITAFMIDTSMGDVIAPVVSASPTGGSFFNSVDVTLSATDNFDPSPTIFYTTDGSAPTTASPVYTAPITITSDTTLSVIAVDSSGNVSPVITESYLITIDPTVPVVSASPTGGLFFNSVDVTLSATDDTDPSPTIYYTIDGSAPTTASPVYTAPITITSDTTLNFMATDAAGNVSDVSTETYLVTIDVTAPTVSASPIGSTYVSSVDVTLTATDDTDPAPAIYYTTDGSTPTTSSTLYTGLITITANTILNFIAADAAGIVSLVSTEEYLITTSSNATLTINSVDMTGTSFPGFFTTVSEGGTVVGTGFTPMTFAGTGGATYTVETQDFVPFLFSNWEDGSTIAARDVYLALDTTVTASYLDSTGDVTAPTVSASPTGGTYLNLAVVTLSATDETDPTPAIYFTIDGSTPTTASSLYFAPIPIVATTTLNFIAIDATGNTSAVSTENYLITIDVTAPVVSASPTGGVFPNSVDVTLTATDDTDPAPAIYYTTDGSTPTTSSTLYTGLITITANTILNFIAADAAGIVSLVSTEEYLITTSSNATLTINSVDMTGTSFPGFFTTVSEGGTVVGTGFTPMTFAGTGGATYTVETQDFVPFLFSNWEDGSTIAARDVTLSSDTTVTASYLDSTNDVTVPTVLASPTGGTYAGLVVVTLSATDDLDPTPAIYFTTDGSTPTTASPLYFEPIPLAAATTLNFIAVDATGNTSAASTEVYVIIPDVTAPVVSASPTGGAFLNSVDVTLTATDNTDPTPTIYFTTDGSTPTTSSTVFTIPITITANTILNFIAADAAGIVSLVSTEEYLITTSSNATLTINSVDMTGTSFPGFFTTVSEGGTVVGTGFTPMTFAGTGGATYTVETQDFVPFLFSNWEDGSTIAARDVTLSSDTTVTASYLDSTNDVTVPTVLASPTGGTYAGLVVVTLSATDDLDPTPAIYFTTDGSTPTTASPLYFEPIPLAAATTLNFIAVDATGNTSAASTEVYVIIPDVTAPVVSASPTGGSFAGSVDVTLIATDDANPTPTIYYTTDGSTPTTSSPVYTGPITITTDTTLSFLATDLSGNTSLIGTQVYVITIPPETGPTNAVFDSVLGQYDLSWTTPTTTLGVPSGGFDIWIDGIDTNETWRTTATSITITGLDTTVAHCFEIQSRWNQVSPSSHPISNEICVPPL